MKTIIKIERQEKAVSATLTILALAFLSTTGGETSKTFFVIDSVEARFDFIRSTVDIRWWTFSFPLKIGVGKWKE